MPNPAVAVPVSGLGWDVTFATLIMTRTFPITSTAYRRPESRSICVYGSFVQLSAMVLENQIVAMLAARGESPPSHRDRRGTRLTRREEGEYREYSTDEQRSQPGCIVGRMQGDFCHGLLGVMFGQVGAHPPQPVPQLGRLLLFEGQIIQSQLEIEAPQRGGPCRCRRRCTSWSRDVLRAFCRIASCRSRVARTGAR